MLPVASKLRVSILMILFLAFSTFFLACQDASESPAGTAEKASDNAGLAKAVIVSRGVCQ
jgi:hypothetical protein